VMAGTASVGMLGLPAATVETSIPPADVPPGFDPMVYEETLRFTPGGLVDIDPALVVSGWPAEIYEVLPGGFGLARLVASGILERRSGSLPGIAYYYIADVMPRFPGGLAGAPL